MECGYYLYSILLSDGPVAVCLPAALPFLLMAFILWLLCMAIHVVVSLASAPPSEEQVSTLTWNKKVFNGETKRDERLALAPKLPGAGFDIAVDHGGSRGLLLVNTGFLNKFGRVGSWYPYPPIFRNEYLAS